MVAGVHFYDFRRFALYYCYFTLQVTNLLQSQLAFIRLQLLPHSRTLTHHPNYQLPLKMLNDWSL